MARLKTTTFQRRLRALKSERISKGEALRVLRYARQSLEIEKQIRNLYGRGLKTGFSIGYLGEADLFELELSFRSGTFSKSDLDLIKLLSPVVLNRSQATARIVNIYTQDYLENVYGEHWRRYKRARQFMIEFNTLSDSEKIAFFNSKWGSKRYSTPIPTSPNRYYDYMYKNDEREDWIVEGLRDFKRDNGLI